MSGEAANFWAGEGGHEYAERNKNPTVGGIEANQAMFARILRRMDVPPTSVLEIGAGRGNALRALRRLLPDAWLAGIEINPTAYAELRQDFTGSTRASLEEARDLQQSPVQMTLTKGFLIHVHPAWLQTAYGFLFENSSRYILLCEYYAPKPVAIAYRGQTGLLWKRDFAGEMLDRFPDLKLVDTGWVYHRSPHPQDDLTWFLLSKDGR